MRGISSEVRMRDVLAAYLSRQCGAFLQGQSREGKKFVGGYKDSRVDIFRAVSCEHVVCLQRLQAWGFSHVIFGCSN